MTLLPSTRAKKGRGGVSAPGTAGWLRGVADTDAGRRAASPGPSCTQEAVGVADREWGGGGDGGAEPADGLTAAVAVAAGSSSRQPTAFNVVFLTCPRMAFHHPGDVFFFDFLAKLKDKPSKKKKINLYFFFSAVKKKWNKQ